MPLTDEELSEIYQRYAPTVFRRCRSILGNDEDAADAVHEVFARVIRHGDRFRQEASPMTFMYRISTNYCLNQLRNKRGRRSKLEDNREEIGGDGVVAPDTGGVDSARVRELLQQVDDDTRRCVIHTYFDDCTRQETATLVGISVPTVRKRVNAFLDLARRELGLALAALLSLLAGWSP